MQSYFPTGQIFFQPPEILTSQSLQYNVKRIQFPKKGKIKSEYRMVNLCNSETKGLGELCKFTFENLNSIKGTETKWSQPNFSGLTTFEFTYHDKVTFFSARTSPNFSHFPRHVIHVRFPSILHQRAIRKIFSIISVTQRIIRTRTSNFYYLIDMNTYTRNLPLCNSGQYIYVTGLRHFFLCSSRFD